MRELLMGNEAIAVGALLAGVQVVAGYPGTPSSEVLETVARRNPGGVHVEWSVNEKVGAELAAGAAYAGARSMVTMKQMGLNVASDPVMCVNYIGVKGGMVIYIADDPGPISSQTEQDTRSFGRYAHIPVFDCDSPKQAFYAVQEAFEFSEKYGTPVILRSTTRVCHACEDIEVPEIRPASPCEGFIKDSKWVIFPRLAYKNKLKIAAREPEFSQLFSDFLIEGNQEGRNAAGNAIEGSGNIGIACGGISYAYVMEAISGHEEDFTVLKIATPYPFPADLARKFLMSVDKVLVFEELDPFIEDSLISEYGNMSLDIDNFIEGKRTGTVPAGGELSASLIAEIIESASADWLGKDNRICTTISFNEYDDMPPLPVRPPVLCAGCPHRGAFYAVKSAVREAKAEGADFTQAIYCGDIGCYTLGNAAPLDMVDTCLCMGAGITVAQGLNHADRSTLNFAFAGDSTFFASGISGVVNAVYNQADVIICILDNSTTAMTGHQPHPGMGITVMGQKVKPVDINRVLEGVGVEHIRTVDPLDYRESVDTVKEAISVEGVRAIIFKSPCIAIAAHGERATVIEDKCVGCMKCISELGCPALLPNKAENNDSHRERNTVMIDKALCTGCGLCSKICPAGCICCGDGCEDAKEVK